MKTKHIFGVPKEITDWIGLKEEHAHAAQKVTIVFSNRDFAKASVKFVPATGIDELQDALKDIDPLVYAFDHNGDSVAYCDRSEHSAAPDVEKLERCCEELDAYKAIYNSHIKVFEAVIQRCPHQQTVDLLEDMLDIDASFIKACEEADDRFDQATKDAD